MGVKTESQLSGIWLLIVRLTWVFVAVFVLVLRISSFPSQYAQIIAAPKGLGVLDPDVLRASLAQAGISSAFYASIVIVQNIMVMAVFYLASAFIIWLKPKNRIALFIAFTFITYNLGFNPNWQSVHPVWQFTASVLLLYGFFFTWLYCFLFPDGRFVPRWTIPLAIVWMGLGVGEIFFPDTILNNNHWPFTITIPLALGFFFCFGYAQIYRYRYVSGPEQRQPVKLFALFMIVGFFIFLGGTLPPILVPAFHQPGWVVAVYSLAVNLLNTIWNILLPVSIVLSIFRYRLWDIDIIINRTLVYSGLTTSIIVLYVFVVGSLSSLLQNQNDLAASLFALLIVGLFIQPLRNGLQNVVNRLLRFDPSKLSEFPQVLEQSSIRPHQAQEENSEAPLISNESFHSKHTFMWIAWLLFGLTVVLTIGFIPLRYLEHTIAVGSNTMLPADYVEHLKLDLFGVIQTFLYLAHYLAYSILGAVIISRQRKNRIGWLFCAIGLVMAIENFTGEYAVYGLLLVPGSLPAALMIGWIQNWMWPLQIGLPFLLLPLLYPNGRLLSERWKLVGWLTIVAIASLTLGTAFMPGPLGNYFIGSQATINNPLGITALGLVSERMKMMWILAILLLMLASMGSLILRLRRATADERQQIKWFVYVATLLAMLLGATGLFTVVTFTPTESTSPLGIAYSLLFSIVSAGLPIATGLAILKYRLYDIDIIINRTLVYGGLTVIVIIIYVLIVGIAGTIIQGSDNLLISILATGLVAILVQPLRDRLQRGINRMMYGERDNPVTVLSQLGQRLEATIAPDAVLPVLTETVAQTLKLPYAAITWGAAHDGEVAAAHGRPAGELIRLPLTYRGETIGHLVVSPGAPGEEFSPADHHLLKNIAHQAGMAVHAVSLTADLQRSRQRLVTAREEERRRLRRDLHDGLGPNLASQGLKLAAVRQLIEKDPAAAAPLLDQVMAQNQSTVDEVRRLVYGLRPPALDELGLVAAIRDHVAGMDGKSTLQIEITEPQEGLPPLTAAIEVAAYRIVLEALTNVIRHAQAHRCVIRFSLDQKDSNYTLQVEIQDDGIGLPSTRRAGVGTRSMRERAEELGGTCDIESVMGSGTRVCARVPLIMV